MFKVLAHRAGQHGLIVLITCHRLTPTAWPGNGLWYSKEISEAKVLESWGKMASALCDQWNVFASDLHNEPHASSWGKGTKLDWNKAAERIGNHVLEACPRWMIFVEGVGYTPGAKGADNPAMGLWWGENLVGTRQSPVRLRDQSKLVYSPHVYGPAVYDQDYFKAKNFPRNLPAVWGSHFLVAKQTGQPIVIGELGGTYTGKDKTWQDWAIPFAASQKVGVFYFSLNPDSADTGGILQDDWTTPEAGKLALLARLPATRVFDLVERVYDPPPPPPSPTPSPPPPAPDAEGAKLLECYANNNADLLAGFCGGVIADCRWAALGSHWEEHGKAEGRAWGCGEPSPPPPPMPPPPPPSPLPPVPPHPPPPPPRKAEHKEAARPPPAPPVGAAVAALLHPVDERVITIAEAAGDDERVIAGGTGEAAEAAQDGGRFAAATAAVRERVAKARAAVVDRVGERNARYIAVAVGVLGLVGLAVGGSCGLRHARGRSRGPGGPDELELDFDDALSDDESMVEERSPSPERPKPRRKKGTRAIVGDDDGLPPPRSSRKKGRRRRDEEDEEQGMLTSGKGRPRC